MRFSWRISGASPSINQSFRVSIQESWHHNQHANPFPHPALLTVMRHFGSRLAFFSSSYPYAVSSPSSHTNTVWGGNLLPLQDHIRLPTRGRTRQSTNSCPCLLRLGKNMEISHQSNKHHRSRYQ